MAEERDPLTSSIISAALEVHRTLGPHYQELTYQRALVLEFGCAGLEFGREVRIPIRYQGRLLHTRRVDFLVEDCIVEIKAKVRIEPEHFGQTLNYLRASGYHKALLLNFGASRLGIKRIVN